MPCPPDHVTYYVKAEADAVLRRMVADSKRHARAGKSYKRLNVFPCGNHFHIGHANSGHRPAHKTPTAPGPVKSPTPGSLRRQAKAEAKAAKRQIRFIQVTYGIAGDAADLAENERIAHRMVEQLFGK